MRTVLLRTTSLFFLLAALVGCDAVNGPEPAADAAPTAEAGDAAALAQPSGDLTIPGQYIVVLAEASVAEARGTAAADLAALTAEVTARGGAVERVYESALTGFAAALTAAEAEALEGDPRVLYVEPDQQATLSGTGTQGFATWGLDRVNARAGRDGQYGWRASGEGVTAYVIDTGIRIEHSQFGGRASYGRDLRDNDDVASDCNGHGTHVAGTVGSSAYGMAKDVDLVAVRVFGCGNTTATSTIIAGFDWVAANAQLPAVANASLGGPVSSAMDAAARGIQNAGVAFVASAGNGYGQNACSRSPARVAELMTVGSTDSADRRSDFSNVGSCVDFFAPGTAITSTWYTSNSAAALLSGTSMAAPHVAGAAAMYLEVRPTATPQQVRDVIFNFSTKGIVTDARSANNHLLFNGGSPSLLKGGDALNW